MKSNTDYVPNQQFALLLQGQPKAGKTSLVVSYFPAPYVIDCDLNINGAFQVLKRLQDAGKVPKDKKVFFDSVSVDANGNQLDEADRWVRLCDLAKAAIKDPQIKTIVVDSLTTVVPILLAYILKNSPSKIKLAGESMMEIQHWQPFGTLMQRFVMMLRTSGKKFVFCAHEEVVKDEVSGILQHRINMPGRLQHGFGALFTDCWRLEQVDNSKQYESKLRCLSSIRLPGLGNTLGLPPELNPETSELFLKNVPK